MSTLVNVRRSGLISEWGSSDDDVGLFGTGSPLASDVGVEVLRSPRDYAAVKRALAQAGYKGERVVVMAPTDVSELGNLTRTGAEQLRRAGNLGPGGEPDWATRPGLILGKSLEDRTGAADMLGPPVACARRS
jgi:hypothetical protein